MSPLVNDYDHVPIEPDPALTTEPRLDGPMCLALQAASAVDHSHTVSSGRNASWLSGSADALPHL